MTRITRAALIQASNDTPGEASIDEIKSAMIDKHVALIEQAAEQGAQVTCLQEIFYGPYFCAEQDTRWYESAEPIPDGPTVQLMQTLAKKHKMILEAETHHPHKIKIKEKLLKEPFKHHTNQNETTFAIR